MEFDSLKLYSLMAAKGLNVKKLADMSGVSRATLSFIVRGKRQPNIDTVGKLAKALDVSVLFFASK